MKNKKPVIIHLSFKDTDEDRKLYKWIISHSGKSNFIKDILRWFMNKELNNKL
jgi:hypothetical protein